MIQKALSVAGELLPRRISTLFFGFFFLRLFFLGRGVRLLFFVIIFVAPPVAPISVTIATSIAVAISTFSVATRSPTKPSARRSAETAARWSAKTASRRSTESAAGPGIAAATWSATRPGITTTAGPWISAGATTSSPRITTATPGTAAPAASLTTIFASALSAVIILVVVISIPATFPVVVPTAPVVRFGFRRLGAKTWHLGEFLWGAKTGDQHLGLSLFVIPAAPPVVTLSIIAGTRPGCRIGSLQLLDGQRLTRIQTGSDGELAKRRSLTGRYLGRVDHAVAIRIEAAHRHFDTRIASTAPSFVAAPLLAAALVPASPTAAVPVILCVGRAG